MDTCIDLMLNKLESPGKIVAIKIIIVNKLIHVLIFIPRKNAGGDEDMLLLDGCIIMKK